MPVEKLFWSDPYLTECDARVTSADGPRVTLDRTVAFAFSGGQASDVGTIGGHEILAAEKDGLEIVYTLPEGHGLAVGDEVTVAIDWPARNRLIRLHFAAELVLELVTRLLGAPHKLGANITAEKARLDFAWDGSLAPELPTIAAEVARLVSDDLPIVSAFSDEATQRRYWEIVGFARIPCGGTHPRRTGEVGRVALKRTNPGAGKERIEVTLVDPNAGL
jgi:Ser-tRNA(Ala) deacylase AlaX